MSWSTSSDAPRGVNQLIDRSATWPYVDWLAANTPLPLVVKGIMTAEDGRQCVEHGVRGMIVSNHGARQLDTTFASVEVLPEVVEAVDGQVEVYLDGGIRRGTDVLKALALGARAVLIGRPLFWGLAVDGEAGFARSCRCSGTSWRWPWACAVDPRLRASTSACWAPCRPCYRCCTPLRDSAFPSCRGA